MITVILVTAVVIIVIAIILYAESGDISEIIVIPLVVGGVAFLIVLMLMAAISVGYIQTHNSEFTFSIDKISETNIRTLQDNTNNISGNFALGFGSVDSQARFYFYLCESDSSFYLKSLSTNCVKIIESDTKKPCVVKYNRYIDWSKNELSNWLIKSTIQEANYYYIYVPKNTIMIKYSLDAQ